MLFVAFFSQFPAKTQAFGLAYRVVSPLPPQLSQCADVDRIVSPLLPPQVSQLLHVSVYTDVDTAAYIVRKMHTIFNESVNMLTEYC